MKKAVIIGAGPAGLTAAYELLTRSSDIEVIVLEESDVFGGISKTVNYKGNRMDMGGHRFFSKIDEVNEWWDRMLPGRDPDKEDDVMLSRHRVSRILFDSKFYDYPISLKPETFINMGLRQSILVAFSYLKALLFKLPEDNLENFYINRFGRKLYSMFFEYYTENLWGRHPREIDASWGAQRVKGLSVMAVIKDVFGRIFAKKDRVVETSLIEEFKYPKYGPGQLWEITAKKIKESGGTIIMNARAVGFDVADGNIKSVTYRHDGGEVTVDADYVISSMPIKDLVAGMNDVPADIADIAAGLPYRDYMTLGVLVSKLELKNRTKIKTVGNIVPDCWVYVQDRKVRMGRFQIYNNWSPYMVKDLENTVWIGLEYFVNEGDEYWNMTEEEFSKLGISEILKLGIIGSGSVVLDTHMEKVKKAYPAYFDTYKDIDRLTSYLKSIRNLFCVGRNGQHRYNNIDHSMVTSFETVKCILTGSDDRDAIWNVNTEKEYHEEKN
ncbi:MAG: NAD(P)/FAD-dependent oxidoreductase [Lachnospiraceae bacterium]|nr:NAD(P)/FAD-dependent oxidoreductase [Lachnospiraceae bacterium]